MTSPPWGPARAGRTAVLAALLFGVAAAGCGQKQGRVTGRVLLDGQPVPGGILQFIRADLQGGAVPATVDEAGNYTVVLPAGDMLISFDNRHLAPRPPAPPPPIPKGLSPELAAKMRSAPPPAPPPEAPVGSRTGRYVKVPDRYSAAETAHLTFTVTGGDQKYDVELTSKP